MRLLVLSLNAPVPVNSGVKMRTWSVLRALAAEGHDITLITFVSSADEFDHPAAAEVCSAVFTVPLQMRNLTSKADYASRMLSLLSGKPYAIRRFASAEMRERVAAELATNRYDAVICESAYAMVNVPETTAAIVLDNHNVEHLILQRYAEYESNPAKRLYARLEADRLRHWNATPAEGRRFQSAVPRRTVGTFYSSGLRGTTMSFPTASTWSSTVLRTAHRPVLSSIKAGWTGSRIAMPWSSLSTRCCPVSASEFQE